MDSKSLDAVNEASSETIQVLRIENKRLARRVADLERKISLQAQTGLPTHFQLEIDLDETIESYRKSGDNRGFSVLIIQLGDSYRTVRKSVKSGISEWILYQIACRIKDQLRPEDRVFHTHENEFVLILPALKGADLTRFFGRIYASLNEPHIFSGFNIVIKTTTGIAYWPEHGEDRSSLLHHADIAAGTADESGKPYVLFKTDLLQKAVEKVELQNSIIRAIETPVIEKLGEQFHLYYQPKLLVSGFDGKTLQVERIEAEALIRWNHPEKGFIMPSTFIPLAEETGLIIPLGKWLIYQCVRKMAAWGKAGRKDISLSINLSAHQFRSNEAADILQSALSAAKLDPDTITIEITETCLFEDPSVAAVMLKKFKDIGVRLSVDDFGTGFSSLSHLHRFPLDEIKIDRLFVENLSVNHQDRIIVRSLVSIAKGLGLSLVAEGVEKKEDLKLLWEMDCRTFQGYLIAKPLNAENFIAFYDRIVADGYTFRLPEPEPEPDTNLAPAQVQSSLPLKE